jgi:anti-sigma factor RsiW
MTRAHLSADKMTDLLYGEGSPEERQHVAGCETCRACLQEARAALDLASTADVPEPPPLYWEALRRNVRRGVAAEPEGRRRWGWMAAAAAAAGVLAVVLALQVRPPERGSTTTVLPAWSALPPVEEDVELTAALGGLGATDVTPMEWAEGPGLGAFLAGLSDEESETLVEALSVDRREGEL